MGNTPKPKWFGIFAVCKRAKCKESGVLAHPKPLYLKAKEGVLCLYLSKPDKN